VTSKANHGARTDARDRIVARHSPRRLKQQLSGDGRAPADHNLLGIKRVDGVRDSDADTFGPYLDDLGGDGIAVPRRLHRVGA
jgi:hypothetical protein